jgi:hypothetical protein
MPAGEFVPAGSAMVEMGKTPAIEKEDGLPSHLSGLTDLLF